MALNNDQRNALNDLMQKQNNGSLTQKQSEYLNKLQYANSNGGSSNNNNSSSNSNTGYQKRTKEYDPKTYVKKSGCKTGRYSNKEYANKSTGQIVPSESKPYTQGWKASKRFGLISFMCVPTSNSKSVTSESGKVWITSIACTVTNKQAMTRQLYWGLMEKTTGKVIIQDLGIVLNPKGGKGGVVAEIGKNS